MKTLTTGLIVAILFLTACGRQDKTQAIIEYVIDGDTVRIVGGKVIRLAGIDTPEPDETGYSVARDALGSMIHGKEVWIEYAGEDSYGRSLAYLWLGDHFVQGEMLRLGHADLMIFPNQLSYLEELIGAWSQKGTGIIKSYK